MNVKTFASGAYFLGLILLAAALPFWLLLMSLAQFVIAGAWLLHGDLREKIKSLFKNKALLAVLGLYILHVAGVFYSTDLDYALDDLRIKLPLFLLPLTIGTMPSLTRKQFHIILITAATAVTASTLCLMAVKAGWTGHAIQSSRDISIFISHIRLALLICTALVICTYFFIINKSFKWRLLIVAVAVWLILFLFILQSFTGIVILSALVFTGGLWLMLRSQRPALKILSAALAAAVAAGGILLYKYVFIDSIAPIQLKAESLKEKTSLGNRYVHYPEKQDMENGYPVWININEDELRQAWNQRSAIRYDSLDRRSQEIKYTLIRFLTSCGYDKDAAGVNQLTQQQVAAIENGIANREFIYRRGLGMRIKQLAWEYRNYHYSGNPSGHSMMQRMEFWKTGLYILKKHPLYGTGTGDVKKEYEKAYVESNSKLQEKFRLRAHNEYLTMFITFGIPGGLYFIFSLFYPWIKLRKKSDLLYTGFLIILCLSMIGEDTPESQPGATFMAFFNSLLLFHHFGRPDKDRVLP